MPKSLTDFGSALSPIFFIMLYMNHALPAPAIVAILAGGKARRFDGKDKGEILIHEERLIDIIYQRLKLQSTDIIISGKHDYDLDLTIVSDAADAPGGPVGGIYSIWKSLQGQDVEGFFTVAVDGPNLPENLISSLYSENFSAIAVDDAGRHPTYGWWRMSDLTNVWKAFDFSESISLNRLADLTGVKSSIWEGTGTFLNINRRTDLVQFVKEA